MAGKLGLGGTWDNPTVRHYSTALESSSILIERKLVVRILSSLSPFLWEMAVVWWEEDG